MHGSRLLVTIKNNLYHIILMTTNRTGIQKRAGYSKLKKICSKAIARIKPYAFALGIGLAAPLAAGCIHLEGPSKTQDCESKSMTEVSGFATNSKGYAFRNNKLYLNGVSGICPPDAASLVEADVADIDLKVIADNVGPVGNIDGPYLLILSGPSVKKDGNSCLVEGLTSLTIYNADTGTIGEIPVKATVAWLSGSMVAYEADNGTGGFDVHIYDFVTGSSGRLVQNMRLVQEGMPFNGKVVYAYDNSGLYSVDVLTSKPTLQNADNTIVPYLAGDRVVLHDKTQNIVIFSHTTTSGPLYVVAAESWLAPRPVAAFGDYVIVISPDLGVQIINLKKICDASIPITELTEGWDPPSDISGFVARLLPASQNSFIYEFSIPGTGQGSAVLVGLK